MRVVSVLALSAVMLVVGLGASAPAKPVSGSAARARVKLRIRVVGLPKGERGVFTLTGPRQSPRAPHPLHRRLSRRGASAVGGLRPGLYRVRVSRVRLRGSGGEIAPGAVAFPLKRKLRLKLKAGGGSIDIAYGTIVNPGVRDVSKRVLQVLGDRSDPSAVVLKGGGVGRGTILSAEPSALLPRGLLARVIDLRGGHGRVTAYLEPESIYDVAPNMSFSVPLSDEQQAQESSLIKCGSDFSRT